MTEYEIRVTGHLMWHRFHGFDHMTATHHANGETTIEGSIPDQAALFGLLLKVRDLGLPLLSVNQVDTTLN